MEYITAIIVAAGNSRRLGRDKLFLEIAGEPVLIRTLTVYEQAPEISEIILVVREDCLIIWDEMIANKGLHKVKQIVTGGQDRMDSVAAGLAVINQASRMVVVHDGARPLLTGGIISRVIEAARQTGAATAGVPVKDTIKMVDPGGQVRYTLPRDELWSVQTPQAFLVPVLINAYQQQAAKLQATDDCVLVEKAGYPVKMVMGSYRNLKITTEEDVILAEALIAWGEDW